MKTTVELPDELARELKVRAAREGRKLKDVMTELLHLGLQARRSPPSAAPARVRLPLVRCAHPARPDEEMTPERTAAILLAGEASAADEAAKVTGPNEAGAADATRAADGPLR